MPLMSGRFRSSRMYIVVVELAEIDAFFVLDPRSVV
jgi:hypothetical protein